MPGQAGRRARGSSSASSRSPLSHRAGLLDDVAQRHRVERQEAQIGLAEIQIGSERIGHRDAEQPRRLRGLDAVARIFEGDRLARRHLEPLERRQVKIWVWLGAFHVLSTHDGIEVAADPEAVEVVHDPFARGARCDGRFEPELTRGDQVIEDAGQKLLQSRRLLVVEDLERLEIRLDEFGAGLLDQVDDGIEWSGCGPDDRQPPFERQLLAMLAVDALPGAEDRDFRVHEQAIEIEDECADHRLRWKNSRMRRSMSTRSCSERGMCRSFGYSSVSNGLPASMSACIRRAVWRKWTFSSTIPWTISSLPRSPSTWVNGEPNQYPSGCSCH